MCLYQSTFDANIDCGGTHIINDICVEVRISNRLGWGSKGKNYHIHLKQNSQRQTLWICDQYFQLAQLVTHFALPWKLIRAKFDNLNTIEQKTFVRKKKRQD
jgi:hypothetical protein